MPDTIERGEVNVGGGEGFTPVDTVRVDEFDRRPVSSEGLTFLQFIAMKLTRQMPGPSDAISEHFDHGEPRNDPAPKFKDLSYLG